MEQGLDPLTTYLDIIINGINKTIVIDDCLAIQQSFITLINPEIYRNDKILVIDIGGVNINVSHWRNKDGLCLYGKQSFMEGYNKHVVDRVEWMLRISFNIKFNLGLKDILKVIDEGSIYVNGEVIDVSIQVNNILEEYAGLITRKIEEYKFCPKGCNYIILTGGGAESLSKYLKKVHPVLKLVNNPLFSNAIAFNSIWTSQYIYEYSKY